MSRDIAIPVPPTRSVTTSDVPSTAAPVVLIVYTRELRAQLRTFLAWFVPLAGLLALVCALQPSLANGPLGAKLASMPTTMRRAFGLEMVDFQSPAAYLATNSLTFTLGIALFAGLLGASLIAKEETLHTAELLYAQPTSRSRILAGKLAAAATYILALPLLLAVLATAILALVATKPVEPTIVSLFLANAATALCFAGLGALAAASVREARNATGLVLGVVLGSYFLGIVSVMAPGTAPLRYLSPFKWNEPVAIIAHGVHPLAIAASLVIAIAAGFAAVHRYARRDLHA